MRVRIVSELESPEKSCTRLEKGLGVGAARSPEDSKGPGKKELLAPKAARGDASQRPRCRGGEEVGNGNPILVRVPPGDAHSA